MTAPAAPHIHVNSDGSKLYIRWQAVQDATDYNVYYGDTPAPTGLEVELDDTDVNPDGWLMAVGPEDAGQVYVRVTALNLAAEESGYSNEVQRNLMGPGYSGPSSQALKHVKGA